MKDILPTMKKVVQLFVITDHQVNQINNQIQMLEKLYIQQNQIILSLKYHNKTQRKKTHLKSLQKISQNYCIKNQSYNYN